MSDVIEVRVPDIGDFSDVPVIETPVGPGDVIAEGDTLIVLESDKATLDVPSPAAGKVVELRVSVDDRIGEGTVILMLEVDKVAALAPAAPADPEAAPAPEPAAAPTPAPASASAPTSVPTSPAQDGPGKPVHAPPSVRKFARQLGVEIADVTGTGPKSRITQADVQAFVKAKLTAPSPAAAAAPSAFDWLPEWPQVDHAKFGPVERVPLSRIAKLSGPALARNAMLIPHVTNFDKCDVTELEAFRKAMNAEAGPDDAKLTVLAFAVKAVVSALKAFPKFNASLDGDALVIKSYWNIGVAADTPDGLVVPVVKGADRKGLREIAAEMASLAAAARSGKIKPADMQGATFTISSLGGIGGTNFTPIINAPEVAILGMPRSEIQPVWDGAGFQPRLIQPLGLSFDHRVVDGVASAQFLRHVAAGLNDFRRLAL